MGSAGSFVDVIRFPKFEPSLCTRAGSNGSLFAAKLHLLRVRRPPQTAPEIRGHSITSIRLRVPIYGLEAGAD